MIVASRRSIGWALLERASFTIVRLVCEAWSRHVRRQCRASGRKCKSNAPASESAVVRPQPRPDRKRSLKPTPPPAVAWYNRAPYQGESAMTISMYHASVPILIRMLTNLKGILEKGAAYAQVKKIEEAVLLNARLYPDMFVFTRQVQIACDFARGTGARLAG